jgi:hypothetical protein
MKKKIVTVLFLIILASTTVFADGDMPNTGKSCPNGSSCLVQGNPDNDKKGKDETTLPISLFVKIQYQLLRMFI